MKYTLSLLLCFAIPILCMAQYPIPVQYEYDASGNRVSRLVIHINPLQTPQTPAENSSGQVDEWTSGQEADEIYYVEKIGQTEIKIFPNPTTEKITLEISNWQELQTGVFTLFSSNGQLIKEQTVQSSTTTVSLAGMPAGSYILKVFINGKTENWKIIKH